MTSVNKKLQTNAAIFRLLFGLVWVITASFKWTKPFQTQLYSGYLKSVSSGAPSGLKWWFNMVYGIMGVNPSLSDSVNDAAARPWGLIIAILETLIALSLVLGFAQKIGYIGASILCFFIWGAAESFGLPWTSTSTDIGNVVIHILVFIALMGFLAATGPSKWTLDTYLSGKISWWRKIAL